MRWFLLIAVLAGCPSTPSDDEPVFEPATGEMHCGFWTASMDLAPTDFWEAVEVCFLIRLHDAATGAPVDEAYTGRTEVRWYLPMPVAFTGEPRTFGGGDCLFYAIDEDGATNGWQAELHGDSGVCRLGDWETTPGMVTSRGWAARGGSIWQTEAGNWAVSGTARAIDYIHPPDAPLHGTVFEDFASFAIEAAPVEAEFGWPTTRFGGHCDTDGAFTASEWTATVLEDERGSCQTYADDTVGQIGQQSYSFVFEGHGLEWSDGTIKKLVKTHGGCVYGGPTSTNWVNAVDFDADRVAATYSGLVEEDGVWGACTVAFEAPLVRTE